MVHAGALAILPVALRLAMLPHFPVPTPGGYDEFAHLLVADTLGHFRLANPPHPLHQFFETIFVLQEPAYASIFPIGQGLVLSLGRMLFGSPWAGVLLSVAALCALCYWMLLAWTTPDWALVGGLLAVIQFGPLRYWMNTYWGGAVSAAAGCLVCGSLPRLRARWRIRDATFARPGDRHPVTHASVRVRSLSPGCYLIFRAGPAQSRRHGANWPASRPRQSF